MSLYIRARTQWEILKHGYYRVWLETTLHVFILIMQYVLLWWTLGDAPLNKMMTVPATPHLVCILIIAVPDVTQAHRAAHIPVTSLSLLWFVLLVEICLGRFATRQKPKQLTEKVSTKSYNILCSNTCVVETWSDHSLTQLQAVFWTSEGLPKPGKLCILG